MDHKQAQSKVENLVKGAWEKVEKPLPPGAESPGSPAWIGWSSRISPPFPAGWPPDGKGSLYYYAYATGFSPSRLADAEVLGPVWARVKVDAHGKSAPQLEILAKEIKEVGIVGVRPLKKEEIAVYKAEESVVAQVFEASRKTGTKAMQAPLIRQYYCAWSKDTGVGDAIQQYHPEFFRWLGCR